MGVIFSVTRAQVEAFQAGPEGGPKPLNFLGQPLGVDGNAGPQTKWAMDMATQPQWRQDVVRFLVQLHGMREDGVNRGPVIDRALSICRLDNDVDGRGPSDDGYPWCAALASLALSLYSPFPFVPDALVKRLVESLYPIEADQAKPGDLAYKIHADGTGHVGTLIAQGGGWSASVDGNLGNQVRSVRYPSADRQYCSVEPPVRCPLVPLTLPVYSGSTR